MCYDILDTIDQKDEFVLPRRWIRKGTGRISKIIKMEMNVSKSNLSSGCLSLLNEVVDRIREGVVVCDQEGRVRTWNQECEKIYNIRKEEILGRKLEEFFPDAIDVEVLRTGKSFKDIVHKTQNRKIMISASPLYSNGELIGCVSTDRDLEEVIDLDLKLKEARRTIETLTDEIVGKPHEGTEFFVGANPAMKEQLQKVLRSAGTDVPIFISGETGTGKELLSRFIHRESQLQGKFVAVNCSAIPDSLFESEFFGYVKGAFTGADQKGKAGYFEQADSGTLFLDEISELPLAQQTKLLRVLQEGKVRRLGSERDIPVNVRIISACNVDLQKLVDEKEFRIDLYYRIKGIGLRIPPLRERREDLEDFIRYFFEKIKKYYRRDIETISPEAMAILRGYHWAGNMRELENVMRQMVVMTTGRQIEADVIPREIRNSLRINDAAMDLQGGLKEQVRQFEAELITRALALHDGNIARTADFLKVPRTTLQSKLNQIK